MFRKTFFVAFGVIIILGIFGSGFYFGKSQMPASPPEGVLNAQLNKPEGLDFSLFWEGWRMLEEKFVDSGKIDYKKMLYGAIAGATQSLKDPYTVYLPPEDTKIFKEDVSGEFQGVGMEIGLRNEELTVIAPLKNTPAEKAGLRAGDKIIKINGTSTQGMIVEEAVKLIRGPKGTEVILTIMRNDWKEGKDFTLVRDIIEIPSVGWELLEDEIAHIKIYQFSEVARFAFQRTVPEILDSSAKKIIIDLRNNPGGYLEVVQNIAGWLLEKDALVVIEDFGGKKENKEYRAEGSGIFTNYPTVVLINGGSASGSEILAGALRDNHGIKLIGEKSFGKGSVQELEELKEGSLKITVARWLTPKGDLIAERGLEPDIVVKITEKDYNEKKDPQLDKAIEILMTQ